MTQKAIFITGAAAGIGRATAEHFAQQGWFVGLFDRDAAGVAKLSQQLGETTTVAGELDVTQPAQWQTALEQFTKASGGRLDVLLNNAGILSSGNYTDIPLGKHHAIMNVNVNGVFNGCHTALPYLKQTAGSRVINMCSSSALYGQPQLVSYSASKFAVRGITESLDLEWESLGIRVMDIFPLFVQTDMLKDVGNIKSIRSLGAKLTPQDVAKTIWKAANHQGARTVHWPVGNQTRLSMLAVKLSPDFIARGITKFLAAEH